MLTVNTEAWSVGRKSESTLVIQPRTGLMSLFDPPDYILIVFLGPTVSHLGGHGRSKVHPPGSSDGGISVSVR